MFSFNSEPVTSASGIKTVAFDQWHPQLDEALACIPDDKDFPHELIRLLAERRGSRQKRIWLITQHGTPIAVAPLRRANIASWQPITQYILPGTVVPAAEGRLYPALELLGINVRVALWRMKCAPPVGTTVHDLNTTPTHGMSCSEDFEAFWKSSHLARRLRSARNKWRNLVLKENEPGSSGLGYFGLGQEMGCR